MPEKRLFTVREIADHFRVTTRSAYQWIADGKLDAVRVSNRIRVTEDAVQRMMRPARERRQAL